VKSGTWEDTSADATGTAGHFRVKDNGGTTCHIQGTVTLTGGGGDMTLDNTTIVVGQSITVTSFSITAGGA
jgi:polyisoprenoid-binding protein YceI